MVNMPFSSIFNIFWSIPPWRWFSQGQAVGGGRRLFLACSSGRCNQGATKVQPRCSQVLRLFSFSSTLLSEKLFWHGWSGMICFLITNVIVNLWSALLTCETWLRPTNTLWRLSQEGRWTRRATGQLSKISNIWNNRSQGILIDRFEMLSRYVSDLFYMAPIYHQAFTKLGKLLVIDSTDLTIVSDIKVVKRVNIFGRKPIGFRICGSSLKRWTTAPWCWSAETSPHTIW